MASWPLMPLLSCTPFLYGCDRDITLDPLRHFERPFPAKSERSDSSGALFSGALRSYRSALCSPERSYWSALFLPWSAPLVSGALRYSAILLVERFTVVLCRSAIVLFRSAPPKRFAPFWSAPGAIAPAARKNLGPPLFQPNFRHLVTLSPPKVNQVPLILVVIVRQHRGRTIPAKVKLTIANV